MRLKAWGDWEADPARIYVPIDVDPDQLNKVEVNGILLLAIPVVVLTTGWVVAVASTLLTGSLT